MILVLHRNLDPRADGRAIGPDSYQLDRDPAILIVTRPLEEDV